MPDPLVTQQNADAPALSATTDSPAVVPAPESQPAPPSPNPTANPLAEGVEVEPAETQEATEEATTEQAASPEQPARVRSTNPFGERLSELAQQRRQAEQRADRLAEIAERQAAAIDRLMSTNTRQAADPAPVSASPSPEPRPSREHFDTPEAYDEAWLGWTTREAGRIAQIEVDRKLSEQRAADETAAAQRQQRERIEANERAWQERKAKAIERFPDYSEQVDRDDLPISGSMAFIIKAAEQGPEIAYHLAKHPEEAARIAAMVLPGQYYPEGHPEAGQPVGNYQRQLYELGRIAAVATAPRPEVTRAPPPIKPLGAMNGARPKTPAEMTAEEYGAYRMPQLQAERRPGMLGVPVGEVVRRQ